jgi:3',5'-cyclic-AMP phosphodiesterase
MKKKKGCMSKISNAFFTLLLAVVLFFGFQVTTAFGDNLTFAHVSDVHFSTKKVNTSYRLTAESANILTDVVNQINSTPNVNFVMFTGDQINTPFERELNAFIPYTNNLNCPWYATFGNHDISIGGYLSKQLYVSILKEHNKNFKFNRGYYSFSPKAGYRVIALDSIIDDRLTSNGNIDETQLIWLDKQLAKYKNDVVLIFLHVPVVEPLSSKNHRLLNADKVESILSKYKNPIAVFSGHYHTTKIIQKENVLHVSTPSLISYPNAFRIITISNQKNKTVFSIQLKETSLKEIQTKAKLMAFHSTLYYGDENDRSGIYTIKK